MNRIIFFIITIFLLSSCWKELNTEEGVLKSDIECWSIVSVWENKYNTSLSSDWKCWTTSNMKHLPLSWDYWCYDNNDKLCWDFWKLYTFDTAESVCKQLWEWWRIPSNNDWLSLDKSWWIWWYKKLEWFDDNINESNILLLEAWGYYDTDKDSFYLWWSFGHYWSPVNSIYFTIWWDEIKIDNNFIKKDFGLSLICIRDY